MQGSYAGVVGRAYHRVLLGRAEVWEGQQNVELQGSLAAQSSSGLLWGSGVGEYRRRHGVTGPYPSIKFTRFKEKILNWLPF